VDNDGRRVSRRTVLGAGAWLTASLGLTACGAQPASAGADSKAVATDAFLYGYPLVLTDVTRGASPPNQLLRSTNPPDARARGIVAPQVDTLFALAWLDLRAEPMVLRMPAAGGSRFWLIQVVDAWTNTAHSPSSTDPMTAPGSPAPPYDYVITGPGWTDTLPTGLTRLSMPTNTALLANRIQLDGTADLAAARALQAQVTLMPLSAWTADPTAAAPPAKPPAPAAAPLTQLNAMDGRTFFNRMTALLAANPTPAADTEALKRFAAIGISPGVKVDALDATMLDAAVHDGQSRIAAYANSHAHIENGWSIAPNLGAYGADYALRANTAKVLFGASPAKDTVYALLANVSAGTANAHRRYRLRFAPGQLPPAGAFWSITLYGPDQYFVANPAGVYAVGHEPPLRPNPDGSVEVVLQNARPGPETPTSNWLPIPADGTFTLAMRIYAPRSAALNGAWQPPPLTPIP
jgi:hypothetical protein